MRVPRDSSARAKPETLPVVLPVSEASSNPTSALAVPPVLLLELLGLRQLLVVALLLEQLESVIQMQGCVCFEEVVEARVQVLIQSRCLDPHLSVDRIAPEPDCRRRGVVSTPN